MPQIQKTRHSYQKEKSEVNLINIHVTELTLSNKIASKEGKRNTKNKTLQGTFRRMQETHKGTFSHTPGSRFRRHAAISTPSTRKSPQQQNPPSDNRQQL